MRQGSVWDTGELIEELLGFGEFSGIKQRNCAREDAEIAGALGAIRAIGFVAAKCFLHQYVGETLSDWPGWAQLSACAMTFIQSQAVWGRLVTCARLPTAQFFADYQLGRVITCPTR
jgi:hypothetical protein